MASKSPTPSSAEGAASRGSVSFAGVFIACFHDFRKYLARGEVGMVLVLSRDRDQSKVVFGYIRGILKPSLLSTRW